LKKSIRERLQERIKRNVNVDADTGCWLWTASINNGGYAKMSIYLPGKGVVKMYAHRVAYEVFKKFPRKHGQVAHDYRCVAQHCCNPDHLRKTTQEANERDKKRAAKWARKRFNAMPGPSTSVLQVAPRKKVVVHTSDDLEVAF
jgi:hypothetical protein